MEEPIPHVEEQKEGHDIRLDILHHYDLDFIGNTFEIDSAEKCLSVLKKYQNIKNTIDCNTNFSGKEF